MIDVILVLGREGKEDRSGGGWTEKGQMVKEAQDRVALRRIMRNIDPHIKVGKDADDDDDFCSSQLLDNATHEEFCPCIGLKLIIKGDGRDTKSHSSFLSGAYARESKISHTGIR